MSPGGKSPIILSVCGFKSHLSSEEMESVGQFNAFMRVYDDGDLMMK